MTGAKSAEKYLPSTVWASITAGTEWGLANWTLVRLLNSTIYIVHFTPAPVWLCGRMVKCNISLMIILKSKTTSIYETFGLFFERNFKDFINLWIQNYWEKLCQLFKTRIFSEQGIWVTGFLFYTATMSASNSGINLWNRTSVIVS